jgi:hypothetical protein
MPGYYEIKVRGHLDARWSADPYACCARQADQHPLPGWGRMLVSTSAAADSGKATHVGSGERVWYRHHRLFADLLQVKLRHQEGVV